MSVQMVLLMLLALVLETGLCQDSSPCTFNSMCSCRPLDKTKLRDVTCVGVPLARVPDMTGHQAVHVDLVGSGLEWLDTSVIGQVEALRLITNNIIKIANNTFLSTSGTLRALDLSHNKLQEFPSQALCPLVSLTWLNLHGNQIPSLPGQWCQLKDTLSSLFLGENDLFDLNLSLRNLSHLGLLTVDDNKLRTFPRNSLPESLHSLSGKNNLLTEIPARTLDQLPNLVRVYLQNNLISRVPSFTFKTKKSLDKLDLGYNRISELPPTWFNSSITVRDLNLEHNDIKALIDNVFESLDAGKLVLANNRIENVTKGTFRGLENTLEYLDLEGNSLTNLSLSLSQLAKLKFLYLSNNRIHSLTKADLIGVSKTLKALSLAGNSLKYLPYQALKEFTQLSHVNLGYNRISNLNVNTFKNWGSFIDTLLLMNNHISYLRNNLFQFTPNVRELSLSFNRISAVEPNTFIDTSKSLESLEMSFGILNENFPEDALRPLSALLWLALDNNNIRNLSRTSFHTFANLQYLNLDFNKISHIPNSLFNSLIHTHIRDVRLSYNILFKIDTETFSSLKSLQSVALSGNNIRYIDQKAFKDLPSLTTLYLSDNKIVTLSYQAFYQLPKLMKLELQRNEMKYFSFDSFIDVSTIHALDLNLTHNVLEQISFSKNKQMLKISSLDLSYNCLKDSSLPTINFVGMSLRKLYVSFNSFQLALLNPLNMTYLELLVVDNNNITIIRRHIFTTSTRLQILDLSFNKISHVQQESFTSLSKLRVLIVHHNKIKTLSPRSFRNTLLETLDISYNEFSSIPDLVDVASSLRELDLSYNVLEYLENSWLQKIPFLISLNLCSNRLTILPNDVFVGLNNLLNLKLCLNPLRGNFRNIFQSTQNLRRLDLSSVSLTSVPPIEVPYLVELNLTDNLIKEFDSASADGLPRLRCLLLRANHLPAVPQQALTRLPLLRELDLSLNPIKLITNASFYGLRRLEKLTLTDLSELERFESGSLSVLKSLSALSVQS